MKLEIGHIPLTGLQRSGELPLASLPRIVETLGTQPHSLTFELFIKQRGGNVELRGHLSTGLKVPCQRCLEVVPFAVDTDIDVTLAPHARLDEQAEETALSAGDLEVSFFDGEHIDVLTLLEDELLLLLPDVLCEEDAQGCCTHCGRCTKSLLPSTDPDPQAHPFARLKRLVKQAEEAP